MGNNFNIQTNKQTKNTAAKLNFGILYFSTHFKLIGSTLSSQTHIFNFESAEITFFSQPCCQQHQQQQHQHVAAHVSPRTVPAQSLANQSAKLPSQRRRWGSSAARGDAWAVVG